MQTIEEEVTAFANELYNAVISDELFSYTFIRRSSDLKVFWDVQLPKDFRAIERIMGFISVGYNNMLLFDGEVPCRVSDKSYWGYHDVEAADPRIANAIFLGFDVDGTHYGYMQSDSGISFIDWDFSICDEINIRSDSFFEVLRAKIN